MRKLLIALAALTAEPAHGHVRLRLEPTVRHRGSPSIRRQTTPTRTRGRRRMLPGT